MIFEEYIAKLNLGELSVSEFPAIAWKLIEEGTESESLIILAGMHHLDNKFEIHYYLNCAIDELEIMSPQSLDAAFILANAYVNKVKSGELNVIEAISLIVNQCWDNCNDQIESKKYLYDGVNFEEIIGPWYEYSEIDEYTQWIKYSRKTLDQVKCEIENELNDALVKWQEKFLNAELMKIKN